MVNAPGVTRPKTVCNRTVSMMDIYPTLMDLTGLKAPGPLEGESLMTWLRNPSAPKKTPAVTTYLFGNHAVRTEGWRYIRYKDGGEEMYDRAKDPNEWTNLAAKPEFASVKPISLAGCRSTMNPTLREAGRGRGLTGGSDGKREALAQIDLLDLGSRPSASGLPARKIRPLLMMYARSVTIRVSRTLWSVTRIPMPARFRSKISAAVRAPGSDRCPKTARRATGNWG